MIRLLIAGAAAIGMIASISAADASTAPRHQRLPRIKVHSFSPGYVRQPATRSVVPQNGPAFSPGETWMEDGAIFGHPDDHG